jgi:hypothetical protein
LEATVTRRTVGRQVDASGFGSKPYVLEKGAKGDVVSQTMSEVVIGKGGVTVRVPKTDVTIGPKAPPPPEGQPSDPRMIPGFQDPAAAKAAAAQAAEAAAIAAFKPGGILKILSARYSLTGNSPRNVKNKIEKLVPAGPLTAPVRIPVTDQLHRSAANEPDAVVYTDRERVQVLELKKNVLVVQYEYNGQVLTRQAEEGTNLILP